MPKKRFRGIVDNIEASLVNGDNEVTKTPSELQGEGEGQNNGGACCASEPLSYNYATINNEEQNNRLASSPCFTSTPMTRKENDPNMINVPSIDDHKRWLVGAPLVKCDMKQNGAF
jgi:hypothetical protein